MSQQIPLETIGGSPSFVTFPPDIAVVWNIPVMIAVVIIGVVDFSLLHAISKMHNRLTIIILT